jgi:hypothetical protein
MIYHEYLLLMQEEIVGQSLDFESGENIRNSSSQTCVSRMDPNYR